jgi:TolB protein
MTALDPARPLLSARNVIRVGVSLLALSAIGCAGSSSRPDELAGTIAFIGYSNRVFTVDAADSKVTRIGRRSASGAASWSPDAATLAYSTPDSVIMITNASGDGERRVGRPGPGCYSPIFSPDGNRIACEYTEPNVITVIDVEDGGVVARTPDCCYRPAWSPDGRKIAYKSYGTYNPKTGRYVGADGLYVMDADGSNRRLVAEKSVPDSTSPAWSSNGTIAFVSYGGIWTVRASGAGLRNIVSEDARPDRRLAWSPDGTKLAFQGGDGDFEVFVVNADGSGLKNLTDNQRIQDESPSWSPDGRAITFISNRDGGLDQIFAMRVDGSGETQLTRDQRWSSCCPEWSPG